MFKYNPEESIEQFNFRDNEPRLADYRGCSIADPYFQGWQAVFQYVYDVMKGIRVSAKPEKKAVERFINDLARHDLYIDWDDYEIVQVIANSLRHTKGPIAGSAILLLPWMQFHLFNIFALKYSDKHSDETIHHERKYDTVYCQVARGNAKSQLAAVIGIATFLLTENGSPVVTSSASTREQAKIVFEEIRGMIQTASKSIKKRFKIQASHVVYLNKNGNGKMLPTSSQANSLEGMRISTGILDELHTHPSNLVTESITNSMGSSKEPLLYQITTAGNNTTSHCYDVYKYCLEILDGTKENDRYFVHIFEADEGRAGDDDCALEQANPSIDHAVKRSKLKSDFLTAQMSPAAVAAFETKRLNRWYQWSEAGFADSDQLLKCYNVFSPESLFGEYAYIGIDLASTSDLSTVSLIVPQGKKTYVITKSFIPETAIDKVPSNLQALYHKARMNGSLVVTPGNITDFDVIHEYIDELHQNFRIEGAGIDAAAGGGRFAIQHDDKYNQEIVAVNQGYGLSSSASFLQREIAMASATSKEDGDDHDGLCYSQDDTMFDWALLNGRVKEGQYGDIYVHRPTNNQSLKIDPLIATIIGASLIPAVEASFSIR